MHPETFEGCTPHQSRELIKQNACNATLFTGGPGTGKTYSISRYVKEYLRLNPRASVAAMCPTGKAGVRLTESFTDNGLSLPATTIHRALAPQFTGDNDGQDDSGGRPWNFGFGPANPWPFDLIVGDEWSMVDTWLFARFLGATKLGAKTILVGDPNQLPPVGHGRPFRDMIDAEIFPHGHLSEPHRYAGRIAQVCKAIHDGKKWEPSPTFDLDSEFPENYKHIECEPIMVRSYLERMLVRLAEHGFDPMEDVQILCAVNSKSPMSRETLNPYLQSLVNPHGETVEGCPFRIGDKVICLKNGARVEISEYNEYVAEAQRRKIYVANGEIGRVSSIDGLKLAWIGVTFYNQFEVLFPKQDYQKNLALGYAITCHKSQGSQWPVIILMIDNEPGAGLVCSKPWFYTGISRASKACFTIGRMRRIMDFLRNPGIDNRRTRLRERLKEWQAQNTYSLNGV